MSIRITTLAAAVALASMSVATVADPFYIDVGAAGSAGTTGAPFFDADNYTGLADQWQVYADTTTTQFDTDTSGGLSVNDIFNDAGDAVFTSLIPAASTGPSAIASDTEGLTFGALGSAIVAHWTNLTGYIQSITVNATDATIVQNYTGGSIDFYFQDIGNVAYDFGNGVGINNASDKLGVADNTGFTAGTKVLTLSLLSGTGASTFSADLANYLTGSFSINFDVTYALDNFWNFYDGVTAQDFADLLASSLTLRSKIDANTDNVVQVAGTDSRTLFTVLSDHDGSVEFNRVPEPASLSLLGLGLLGLGVTRRRKPVA